jgi:hypothetical protein
MIRALYGVVASVSALVQDAFVWGPRFFPHHPENFLGFTLASVITSHAVFQLVNKKGKDVS